MKRCSLERGPGGEARRASPPAGGGDGEIVEPIRFAIGIVFGVVGVAVLVLARGSRGFNQRRQIGALCLIAAVVFVAVGLGLVDV